ncbi:MAG: hypothetical protein IPP69_10925 [Flavobacteriales bacterium]|nr:hypothetical protein [Flavobacteriales bacterium]
MRTLFFLLIIVLTGCKTSQQTAGANGATPKKSRKLLTGVTMTSIELVNFPKYALDGEKWDAFAPGATDPDVFIVLKWNENLLFQSETKNDCAYGTPISFSQNLPLEIKPFDQPLLLEVFDEDGVSSNDNMAYFSLNVRNYEGKSSVDLTKGDLTLRIGLTWTYK